MDENILGFTGFVKRICACTTNFFKFFYAQNADAVNRKLTGLYAPARRRLTSSINFQSNK
jgi:hypothetical protein